MGKVYTFYKIKNDDGKRCYPALYAIASSKEARDIFVEFRNMDLFAIKEFKSMKSLLRHKPNIRSTYGRYMLRLAKLRTPNLFGVLSTIELQLTWGEEEKVALYHERICERLVESPLPRINVFNKKIRGYLKILGYNEFYKLNINYSRKFFIPEINDERDLIMEGYREDVDEFKIFILLYGYTVKIK